jgi:hypothetical protein
MSALPASHGTLFSNDCDPAITGESPEEREPGVYVAPARW